MTATEFDEMLKTDLQALIELVHESYFFAYLGDAKLYLENFMEKTRGDVWRNDERTERQEL